MDRSGQLSDSAFGRMVRDALAHLYDIVFLETHPLARFVAASGDRGTSTIGATLRQCILDTIDALASDPRPGGSLEAQRAPRILRLRYVTGLPAPLVQRRLALSKSQYYREHARALDALTVVLARRWRESELLDALGHVQNNDGHPVAAPDTPSERGFDRTRWPFDNVPRPLHSLVDREAEFSGLQSLLAPEGTGPRLVTLKGPPGSGKTRLALEAAARLRADYADGVCFAALASLDDGESVLPLLARLLDAPERPRHSAADSLRIFLRDRQMLLVLDTFEHVLGAAPGLAALLRGCPRLRALVTSRAALRVRGEQVVAVRPLARPDARARSAAALANVSSVALFVERARAARPLFTLTDENAAAVATICRRLDGLPLALELAAARIAVLPPAELAGRLDRVLDVLTAGPRDLTARQRTLRAAIAWSDDLLAPSQRALLDLLGIFRGGFTLEAAEQVRDHVSAGEGSPRQIPERAEEGANVLDDLEALVENSLVWREPPRAGEARYAMLDTIRAYAIERLHASGTFEAVQRAHATYFLALAERAAAGLAGTDQARWLDRIDREHENLVAAVAWYRVRDPEIALGMAASVAPFWAIRGRFAEGRAWLEELLGHADRLPESSIGRARALFSLGDLLWRQGEPEAAAARLAESVAIAHTVGDAATVGAAGVTLGFVMVLLGQFERSAATLEPVLAAARAVGNRAGVGFAATTLAFARRVQGRDSEAAALVEAGLDALTPEGDEHVRSVALWLAGNLAGSRGDCARATSLLDAALDLARRCGDHDGTSTCLLDLGRLAWRDGDRDRFRQCLTASLSALRANRSPLFATRCLLLLGAMAIASGLARSGARLLGAGASLERFARNTMDPTERSEVDAARAAAEAMLGQVGFADTCAAGEALTLDQIIAEAHAIVETVGGCGLGSTAAGPADRLRTLSSREREVARLVARGLSNRQIAANLGIAEATAATHVKHILHKLGLTSRSQVGAAE